ncbi:MAG: hypothetical protein UY51_C0005G0308 [Candidatus Jorgensenbacteria bacterium GW2011_GWB1_49_9]|nr:MAG: hypothetical protein UY51_C0005G0308 [Candidatus Jorgensenbacteria bacterium GW2011_GWB1_49_9]
MSLFSKNWFLAALLVLFGFFLFSKALAVTDFSLSFPLPFENNCPVPGSCPSNALTTASLAAYIVRIYQLTVGLAGILAVGMIVFGSIYMSISGDSPDRREEGRSFIMSAIWGLFLLLGSYVILRTINPQLVALTEPVVQQAPTSTYAYGTISSTVSSRCPNSSSTSCYFRHYTNNPLSSAGEPCLFNDSERNCAAFDMVTDPCKTRLCLVVNQAVILPRITSNPIKPSACAGGLGDAQDPHRCFLENNAIEAFSRFIDSLKSAPLPFGDAELDINNGWRITEAWPPTSPHLDSCHYNGTCLDFARWPPATTTAAFAPFCRQFAKVISSAADNFNTVLVEYAAQILSDCRTIANVPVNTSFGGVTVADTRLQTGFHLHLQRPK